MNGTTKTCQSMVEDAWKDLQDAKAKVAKLRSRYERLSGHMSEYRRFVMGWTDTELRLDPNRWYFPLQYDNRPEQTYTKHDPVVKILAGIEREERDAAQGTDACYRNRERAQAADKLLENIDHRKMKEDVYNSILNGTHPVVTEV